MRPRRLWLIFIGVLVLVVLIVAVVRPAREPSYGGRNLSEWVARLDRKAQSAAGKEAEVAIRHMGTNALSYLLKWIEDDDRPRSEIGLFRLTERLFGTTTETRWLKNDDRSGRGHHAVEALRALGPEAYGAIPQLVHMLNDTNRISSESLAATALGYIGKQSLPALLNALTNLPPPGCYFAFHGVEAMGSNASPALPALIGLLANANGSAASAAGTLGELKLEPQLVVPALTGCLRNVNPAARCWAAQGLRRFGEEARSATPALLIALNDPEIAVRHHASNAVRQIDPKALEQALNRTGGQKGE